MQQINGLMDVLYAEVLRHRRIFFLDFLEHFVSSVAIGKMACRTGTQLRNVNRFGKIHFEKSALPETKRDRVLCTLGGFRRGTLFEFGYRA